MNKTVNYLVKDGVAPYGIVIPDGATPAEERAAAEIAAQVFRATGARLPVARDAEAAAGDGRYLSVGRTRLLAAAALGTDYAALNGDGFRLVSAGARFFIDAATDRGFLYGACEFCERFLGVRYLAVDETSVPARSEIPLPEIDFTSSPAFRMRIYLTYPLYYDGKDYDYVTHSRTLSNWYPLPDSYGGGIPVFQRGAASHNAKRYVPGEKYATREIGYKGEFAPDHEPHPEFYRLKPGYVPDWPSESYTTLNFENGIAPDGSLDETMPVSVAKVVIAEMKKDILANPSAEYVLFEQEDCCDFGDTEAVGKYTAAGVLIRFCNAVAGALQKWADAELGGRKIKIVTFAYNQTRPAPVVKNEKGEYAPIDPTVVPADNLVIRLAYNCFHYYAYGDPRQSEDAREMAASWSAVCKRFWFWGYDLIEADYYLYNPSLQTAQGTARFLRSLGVEYVMMQGAHDSPNDWQAWLKSYVWSKLLWNPDADVPALIDEYLAGYYGPGAGAARRVIELFDAHYAKVAAKLPPGYRKRREVGKDLWADVSMESLSDPENLDPALLRETLRILEEGEDAVRNAALHPDTAEKLLVRLARVKVTPFWMLLKNYDKLCGGEYGSRFQMAVAFRRLWIYAGTPRLGQNLYIGGHMQKEFGIC
ncbi:MAG: DUF4838 domain-containing protein [Clostridiales bacterium]|jgi:hypothetical protein|nr:DUF4838 domain-containing protein [Clostridiales bacterium]